MTTTVPQSSIISNVPEAVVITSPTNSLSIAGRDPNGTTYTPRPVSPGKANAMYSTPHIQSNNLRQQSCYLCDEQNPGDFTPTTTFLETCLLCSRLFCPIHKASQGNSVCNINHSKHYHECFDRAKEELTSQSVDGATKPSELEVEQNLVESGVYPSMGEREKALFRTSLVSDAQIKEIEKFRKLDAELSGTQGRNASSLIEEKDVFEANIAV